MSSLSLVEAEEVRQVIRECLQAARTWDNATMSQIFANDPHAIHFGTAAEETYLGGDAYLRAMREQHTSTIPDMEFDFLPGSPVVQAQIDLECCRLPKDAAISGLDESDVLLRAALLARFEPAPGCGGPA